MSCSFGRWTSESSSGCGGGGGGEPHRAGGTGGALRRAKAILYSARVLDAALSGFGTRPAKRIRLLAVLLEVPGIQRPGDESEDGSSDLVLE